MDRQLGADVIATCLDEKTGEVIWTGRQFGEQIYETPGAIFAPVVGKSYVLVTIGWRQPQTRFVLDKESDTTQSSPPMGVYGVDAHILRLGKE